MTKLWIAALWVFSLLAASWAGSCAIDSYRKACSSCSFDSSGKMDRGCYDGYKASGIACLTTQYPIMNAKYIAGECSAVDGCISELNSCTAQYQSGDDRADCAEGSVSVCYTAADQCMQTAALKCGEVEKQCPGSSASLVLPLLAAAAFMFVRRL